MEKQTLKYILEDLIDFDVFQHLKDMGTYSWLTQAGDTLNEIKEKVKIFQRTFEDKKFVILDQDDMKLYGIKLVRKKKNYKKSIKLSVIIPRNKV